MKRRVLKLVSKICIVVFTGLFTLIMLGGTIMVENEDAVNSVLKVETQQKIDDPDAANKDLRYFKSAFKSIREVKQNGARYAETMAVEGMTLLKNSDSALPLAKGSKVSLYGSGSAKPLAMANGTAPNNITLLARTIRPLPSACSSFCPSITSYTAGTCIFPRCFTAE